ncbi:MAG: FliM/FliN family flagellar motor C-terminal domain-containing protein [Rhizomicrobium sp.]
MTGVGARAWLPKSAFTREAVEGALSEPLQAWAARWFARATLGVARVDFSSEASIAPASNIRLTGSGVEVELTGIGKRHLLEAALDADLSNNVLTGPDRRLLDMFVRNVLEDLVSQFEKTFGPNIENDGNRVIARLALAGHDVLTLHVPEVSLIAVLKRSKHRENSPASTLVRRSAALRHTVLHAYGYLGSTEIGIAELEALGAGDVLVLDRALDENIDLRLTDGGTTFLRGRLCEDAGGYSIQL